VSTVNRNEDGGQDEGEEPSDTALLRRITEGDQAAFAALYDRYNLLAYLSWLKMHPSALRGALVRVVQPPQDW